MVRVWSTLLLYYRSPASHLPQRLYLHRINPAVIPYPYKSVISQACEQTHDEDQSDVPMLDKLPRS